MRGERDRWRAQTSRLEVKRNRGWRVELKMIIVEMFSCCIVNGFLPNSRHSPFTTEANDANHYFLRKGTARSLDILLMIKDLNTSSRYRHVSQDESRSHPGTYILPHKGSQKSKERQDPDAFIRRKSIVRASSLPTNEISITKATNGYISQRSKWIKPST